MDINAELVQKPKLAVLSSRFPYPLEKGDKLRLYYQIKGLSAYFDIYLFAIGDNKLRKGDIEHLLPFTTEIHFFRLDPFTRMKGVVQGVFTGVPFQVSYFYNKKIHQRIQYLLTEIQPDHLYCQLARMALYTFDLPYTKTLDYMDAFGVGMERRSRVANGIFIWIYRREAGLMKKFEENLLSRFDNHAIISLQDKNCIRDQKGIGNISVLPNGIDKSFFCEEPKEKLFDIVFVGNMGYLPNIEAAEFLVNQILPKLPVKTRVLIAGARPHKRVLNLQRENVTIGGWYDDIREAYLSAKIFVAPLWSGTGQQNKILEAMGLGMACVTTTSVNNAIDAADGINILLADDVTSFTDRIKNLLSSEYSVFNIGKQAKKFVEKNYNWEINNQKLALLLKHNNRNTYESGHNHERYA
jgi:glycosyltransferase involved in cell wall biosynthesis